MATISENLEVLKTAKTNIKNAIEGKGQDLTNVPFTRYGEKIAEIQTSENLDAELNEQDTLLAELQSSVEDLQEKPVDMLQWKCDNMKSLYYVFGVVEGTDMTEINDETVCAMVKRLDTSKVTIMSSMFQSWSNGFAYAVYKDLSPITLDMSSCVKCNSMFYNQTYLTKLPTLLNTSNVTNMSSMFYWCANLTTIPDLDVSNVTNVDAMFQNCGALTAIPQLDTRKVTNMKNMFRGCSALPTIPLVDMRSVTSSSNTSSMFSSCNALTNLTLKNIRVSLQIGSGASYGHLLTDASIVNTFQELWDLTGGTAQTLTLSTPSNARTSEIYVKLIDITDEMREQDEYIDNKKPCVVCESTDVGAMTLKEYGISKNWQIK